MDLNAITTPGLYYQPQNVNAQGGKNYPEVNAGSLEVLKHAGVTQIYRIYNNSKCYWRALYGNNWSAWAKVYDNNFRPTAAEVGALPSSGTAVAAVKLATPRLINGIAFDGTQNIGISATAVGAYSKAESDAKYGAKTQSVKRLTDGLKIRPQD